VETDFIVVGSGIAGLRAAVELAQTGRVVLVTKNKVQESNTHYAQGGIAVARGGAEDVALHLEDTLAAGDGLVARDAAALLVSEGAERVEELLQWGAQFDRVNGELIPTREGAHSLPRVLHANGDATGAEIARSLIVRVRSIGNITIAEETLVTRLLVEDGRAVGVEVLDQQYSTRQVRARAVLLASGGAGQVYSDTTNPTVATGDGIALAVEHGVSVADMEFYQFHPTALSLPGVPRFLLSEALRGEGAYLRNDKGERFMERYHKLLELAPRDVVARAITREGFGERPGETRSVYLDMRHVAGVDLGARFPGISAYIAQHGLSLQRDLIPVRPAAHYLMGGIKTDLNGRTSLRSLYAAGEVACTGVHGANRLASNSLLEGLVFGARASKAMREEPNAPAGEAHCRKIDPVEDPEVETVIANLQQAMWHYAGLLRDESGLKQAASHVQEMRCWLEQKRLVPFSRRTVEARSLFRVASTIVNFAVRRKESRGAHFRTDFPQRDDERFAKHSVFGPAPSDSGKSFRYEVW
jgi:L-aspartate oxidase